jgi:hypothetical protein
MGALHHSLLFRKPQSTLYEALLVLPCGQSPAEHQRPPQLHPHSLSRRGPNSVEENRSLLETGCCGRTQDPWSSLKDRTGDSVLIVDSDFEDIVVSSTGPLRP